MPDGPDTQPTLVMDPGQPQQPGPATQRPQKKPKRRSDLQRTFVGFVGPIILGVIFTTILYWAVLPLLRETDTLHVGTATYEGDVQPLTKEGVRIDLMQDGKKVRRTFPFSELRPERLVYMKDGVKLTLEGRVRRPEEGAAKPMIFISTARTS